MSVFIFELIDISFQLIIEFYNLKITIVLQIIFGNAFIR